MFQCFSHRHLGWKINVLDACDKEQSNAELGATSEDLQSRGSIQYTTRVKPDAENKQFYNNGPVKNYIEQNADYVKGPQRMPSVPSALEENLKNDFTRSPLNHHRDQTTAYYNDNYKFPTSQQNFTLYTYPSSGNYTYGNVPFYMPKVHYGSPQTVKTSPAYNYVLPATTYNFNNNINNNNNNYRPVRQPAVPSLHDQRAPAHVMFAQQQPIPVKHGYRVVAGKRFPSNGGGPMPNGAHHSVVYKKPVYKFNGQPPPPPPVPVVNYYKPVLQPAAVVHGPPSFRQFHQQQPQPSTSMSQSVSVSYSSSKHQSPQQHGGHSLPAAAAPQIRREVVNQQNHYHQFQGGFNPNSVVVEGGFKPIVGATVLEDRSDVAATGDSDETTSPPPKRHEKKMNKKLVSRKPAHHDSNKHADAANNEDVAAAAAAAAPLPDTAVISTESANRENRADETKPITIKLVV